MVRSKPIVGPMLLAILLALGAGVTLAMAVLWCLMIGEQLLAPPGVSYDVTVLHDGTPVVTSRLGRTYYRFWRYETLEGEELDESQVKIPLAGASFGSVDFAQAEPSWSQRLVGFSDCRTLATYWYFVHDGRSDGAGYFEGFDSQSKLRVGYLGSGGYRPELPPRDEWFPVDGRVLSGYRAFVGSSSYGRLPERQGGDGTDNPLAPWIVYLLSGERIVRLNLRERSVGVVKEVPGAKELSLFYLTDPSRPLREMNGYPSLRTRMAVLDAERLRLLDLRAGGEESCLLPPEIQGRDFVLYHLGDRFLAVWSPRRQGAAWRLMWFDAKGNVLERRDVVREIKPSFFNDTTNAGWVAALATPAPVAAALSVPAAHVMDLRNRGEEKSYFRALVRGWKETWLPLLVVAAVSAGAAALGYRRQRRYALPWTAAWVTMIFLGSIPGLIGYLVHRRWPPLQACSACGQSTPLDRDHCVRCGAEIPGPAATGIEVFVA